MGYYNVFEKLPKSKKSLYLRFPKKKNRKQSLKINLIVYEIVKSLFF